MALADVSLDSGRTPDLLVVDSDVPGVDVFLGDEGFGDFVDTELTLDAGDGVPIALATGNFDSSGSRLVDVAVLTRNPGRVRIFLNTPDSDTESFDAESDFTVVTTPLTFDGEARALTVGRFNSDTRDDIAVLTANSIYVFLSNGDGTFQRLAPVATTGNDGFLLIASKLDDDEFDDIVVSDPSDHQIKIFTANSGGVLSVVASLNAGDEPRGITAADYDGDGIVDLIVADAVADIVEILRYFPGLGNAQFGDAREATASANSYALLTFDADRNGTQDVVATSISPDTEPAVLLCQPSVLCDTFPVGEPPLEAQIFRQPRVDTIPGVFSGQVGVVSGDVNGDRLDDLFLLSQDGTAVTLMINGSTAVIPTPTGRGTATPTRTRTNSARPSGTPTPTPTPSAPPLFVKIGTAVGRPGDRVEFTVSLVTGGRSVLGVANDLVYSSPDFSLDPSRDCRVNPAIGKELRAAVLISETFYHAFRFSVVTGANGSAIPDGVLYTCQLHIDAGAFSYEYPLESAGGVAVADVGSLRPILIPAFDGSIRVSLAVTPTPAVSGESSNAGGCSLAARNEEPQALGWMAAIPLLLGALRRRKR